MDLKEEIQYNATEYDKPILSLDEMAQAHIDNKVIQQIKDGDFEAAANRYIENHGSSKVAGQAGATVNKLMKGEIAKSIKADPSLVKQISNDEWEKFKQAYAEIQGTAGQKTRQYKKTKGEVQRETGEVKTASQSQKKTMKQLSDKVQSVYKEFKDVYDKAESEEKKEEAESHMKALKTLHDALAASYEGKPPLAPTTDEEIEQIKKRLQKIGKTYVQRQGPEKEKEKEAAEMEVGMRQAQKDIMRRITGIEDLEDIEDLVADFRRRKQMMAGRKADVSGLEDLRKNESFLEKEKILIETYGYKEFDFWENYVGSTLIRMFNEDVKKMGRVDAANSYIELFGEETLPLFKFLAKNTETLNEATKVEGLLFESIGKKNVNAYLTEQMKGSPYGKMLKKTGVRVKGAEGSLKGFLQKTWDKIKEFGGPVINKLGLFLGRGVKWAKELAQKGLEFIWNNPVAKIAVPVVALAGTIGGGIALLNKIRSRAGKPKLSVQEREKFREVVQEKEDTLEDLGAKV